MAAPFISTQDLVDYLGRGTISDPGMLIATDAACDMVRDITEQTFNVVVADTITLDGTGTDVLLLPQLPVSAAGTVTVNGGTVTDYVVNSDDGILIRRTSGTGVVSGVNWWDPWPPFGPGIWPDTPSYATGPTWPIGRRNVQVTYNHGYADAEIPRSVRMVALSIAVRLVVQGAAKQESVGQVSVTYAGAATDLTNGEKAILAKYRRAR